MRYPALKPEYNLKTRKELIDYDYLDKLSHAELDWLNRFTEEYTNCEYRHEGERIHDKMLVPAKKKLKNGIMMVDKFKNKAETANNKRNSDIYSRQRASECLVYFSEFIEDAEPSFDKWEDLIIHCIDHKNEPLGD